MRRGKLPAIPLAAVLAIGALAGCGNETVVTDADEEGLLAEALIIGETVTLQNEVQHVLGPNSMIIAEDTLVFGADVIGMINQGDEVQVTGTVVEFAAVEVETSYGISFDENESSALLGYEKQLAVAAESVTQMPE